MRTAAHRRALRQPGTRSAAAVPMSVEPAVLTWVLLAFDLFNATGETLNRMFDSLGRH